MPTYTGSTPTEGQAIIVAPGLYKVKVITAEEKVSGAGNPMIEMKCKILPMGALVWDNLVFIEAAFWKIDQFRAAIGDAPEPGVEVEINTGYVLEAEGYARIDNEAIARGNHAGKMKNVITAWVFDPEEIEQTLAAQEHAQHAPAPAQRPAVRPTPQPAQHPQRPTAPPQNRTQGAPGVPSRQPAAPPPDKDLADKDFQF